MTINASKGHCLPQYPQLFLYSNGHYKFHSEDHYIYHCTKSSKCHYCYMMETLIRLIPKNNEKNNNFHTHMHQRTINSVLADY